ncbi:hypothetical protein OUZ56_010477 [Daphnia magna]|uniref:MADF domain-containing protein n=1 Tax=Daphnia magna TaxID=35525 RepID=A0ABR0AIS5_9CRUS|nr:hypothetical protein OUZ56_010477 [Daphnia magna]
MPAPASFQNFMFVEAPSLTTAKIRTPRASKRMIAAMTNLYRSFPDAAPAEANTPKGWTHLSSNGLKPRSHQRNQKRVIKIWSIATTERFIQSVEKQPVLYDVTMSNYKNNVSQATARAVIGREFSISPDEVKKKWKQLKDTYRIEKKRLSEEDPSGSGLDGSKRAKKRWTYFEKNGIPFQSVRCCREGHKCGR